MTITLAAANQNAGVAKTTSVTSLGAAPDALGRQVMLVDFDPACRVAETRLLQRAARPTATRGGP